MATVVFSQSSSRVIFILFSLCYLSGTGELVFEHFGIKEDSPQSAHFDHVIGVTQGRQDSQASDFALTSFRLRLSGYDGQDDGQAGQAS
jgi:hypothetical protein